MNKSCKDCLYFDNPLKADGTRKRVTMNDAYRCNAPIPEMKLPNSIIMSYGFIPYRSGKFIMAKLGKDCALYEQFHAQMVDK